MSEVAGPPDPGGSPSPYAARPWLASYPPGVPADFDFPKVPLTRLLDDAAASFPTRTALAFLGTTLSYAELRERADHLASGLAALGVRKGDRVAIVLPNCPQNVLTVFAALRLGAVVVQHNPLSTEDELRSQLADCGARIVVCLDRVHDRIAQVRADTAVEHVIVTSLLDHMPVRARLLLRLPLGRTRRARAELSSPLPEDAPVLSFRELLETSTAARQTPVDPDHDLALLQYTGGTTARPKGAALSHSNLVSNAYMNRLWDVEGRAGSEVTLGVLPLFHAYGLTVSLNATVLLGGTLVLLPRFDLTELFAAIDRWRPTLLAGVPPIYKAIADSAQVRLHDLSSLRACVSGAMRLPPEVQQQFERLSGAVLVEGYGLTETSPSTHCNPLSGQRRAGSIGLPLTGTHCKIVEPDDPSREVPIGSAGELLVKGPQVFQGYWSAGAGDLLSDADVFTDDGYLLTGDIAVMDADGFFTLVDRKKDVIITGGSNVYPSEVEEVLQQLPGLQEAVVAGLPDRHRGEVVKAYVVRAQGSDLDETAVLEHCRHKLSGYKVPKAVEFRDALPHTGVGKVLRRQLVEQELTRTGETQHSAPRARKSPPPSGRSS